MGKEFNLVLTLVLFCVFLSIYHFREAVKEECYECRTTLDEILPHVRQCTIKDCALSADQKDFKCIVSGTDCVHDCELSESIVIPFDDYYYYEIEMYKDRCYYFEKSIHYGDKKYGGPNYIKWNWG